MVDFNTKREVTVKKNQARTDVVRAWIIGWGFSIEGGISYVYAVRSMISCFKTSAPQWSYIE